MIVKKRRNLEFSIHRRISKKSDYMQYIEYESNLEKLISLRIEKKRQSGPMKSIKCHYSSVKTVNALYQKSLKKFSADEDLWLEYLKWAQSKGSSKRLGTLYTRKVGLYVN